MRFSAAPPKKARIEIIPMIDTMFFLLVFFMIATLSMTVQQGMPVNLPEAQSSAKKVVEPVSLTITDQGALFFNKQAITLSDLDAKLSDVTRQTSDPSVVINADEQVEHGVVVKVMDRVRLAGIHAMAIAIKPQTTP